MRQYDHQNLIVHPGNAADPAVVVEVTPELAGWEAITFALRRLARGQSWSSVTGESEMALVVLSGCLSVTSGRENWPRVGERASVFEGLPSALYLPRRTSLTVLAQTDCEYAVALAPADEDYEARLVTPPEVQVEIRGGDQATRQINTIIPPGFPCQRLVVVEALTPGGNWSSYPPHKHDVHRVDDAGNLVEADLEEIYLYKFERPEGFAVQRVYTTPASPLHRAGYPIDALLLARHNDVVLIPEGYHPVASPPGYTTYYLNVLAGSAQSLANSEDPAYAWVKECYHAPDPRIPLYTLSGQSERSA